MKKAVIIGALLILCSTGAFAKEACTWEVCVAHSLKAGYQSGPAGQWCSNPKNLIPWCKQYLK
jgi:hypothetical protein